MHCQQQPYALASGSSKLSPNMTGSNKCPTCSLLHMTAHSSSNSTGPQLPQQQCNPMSAAVVLADQLQRSKHKLREKRKEIRQLRESNSELVTQLIELKAANAALSTKVASLTAAQATADRLAQENAALRQSLEAAAAAGDLEQHQGLALASRCSQHTSKHSRAAAQAATATATGVDSPYSQQLSATMQQRLVAVHRAADTAEQVVATCKQHPANTSQQSTASFSTCSTAACTNSSDSSSSNSNSSSKSSTSGGLDCYEQPCSSATGTQQQRREQQVLSPVYDSPEAAKHAITFDRTSASAASSGIDAQWPPTAGAAVDLAAQQYTQQVLQELNLDVIGDEEQHDCLQPGCQQLQQQQELHCRNDAAYLDWGPLQEVSSTALSSNTTSSSSSRMIACRQQLQQRQQQCHSVLRTGGGYQPCSSSNDVCPAAAASALQRQTLRGTMAQQAEHQSQGHGKATDRNNIVRPPWDGSSAVRQTATIASSAAAATGVKAKHSVSAANGNSKAAIPSRAVSWLPAAAVAVMQDFYRHYCCIECQHPAAAAAAGDGNADRARSSSTGSLVLGSWPGSSLTPPAATCTAATTCSNSSSDSLCNPLVTWEVLERLLLLLDKAFRQRERQRLSVQQARHNQQLTVMKRKVNAAKTWPQVVETGRVKHLKSQLTAARQTLAKRDHKEHSAVMKAAERGYHIGRQLDQVTAEAETLRHQLATTVEQHSALITKVAEAFVSAVQWKQQQVIACFQQFASTLQLTESRLAAATAAAESSDCCWEGLCSGVMMMSDAHQTVIDEWRDMIDRAWKDVQ